MTAFLFTLLLLAGCGNQASEVDGSAPETGEDVIRAMQTAYEGDWYDTITFVQTTINHGPMGADTLIWYEALKLPGRLRIDIGRPSSGDTWIFRNDSIYVYSAGRLANAVPTVHPLLLLGFDVYHMPAADVIAKLDTLGFDLSSMYQTEWNGRPVYAVGADSAGT
ncbi:MAG: hypothetical protein HKN17_11165, partial [Rhodothermales bacterium]|nr:hypothetical protein [Rhodothermales bacterium]